MTAEGGAVPGAATGSDPSTRDEGARDEGRRAPVPVLNVANMLTVSRLVLVPVFLVTLFVGSGHDSTWRWVATIVFVAASITDRIDGDLARRRGLVTDFGKIVDPIADKALTGSALIGLSVLGALSWWATIVIAVRELLVTGLRFWVIRHGVIPASRGGKIKTLLQVVAIGLYLMPLGTGAELVRWAFLGAALTVTVLTGLDYVVRALRLRAHGRRVVGNGGRG